MTYSTVCSIQERRITHPHLATNSCSLGPARGRQRVQMSMVKRVDAELKMEVRSLMTADSMTEIMIPRAPLGRNSNTNLGKAELVQETLEPQKRKHSSGSTHPTSSVNNTRETIPAGRWTHQYHLMVNNL